MLKHFKVDKSRHEKVVDVEFYQMNLISVVDTAKLNAPELIDEDGVLLPSWTKFVAYPTKAKGFFINMLQSIFEGKGDDISVNIDFQTGRKAVEGTKVAMMFLPGSTTNDNLKEIKAIAEQALKGFYIFLASGADGVKNSTAESKVKDAIEKAKRNKQDVLILSAGMAQRSFSVDEITELYLAYDGGDSGATIQKMSRALTPGDPGKIGRIVSLSFDPNRDDKFDSMLLETARNYNRNKKIGCLKEALRQVLKTVDVFKCQEEGAVKLEIDDYLADAIQRNSVDRVVGKISPVNNLSVKQIEALLSGNIDVYRAAKVETADMGKTKLPSDTKKVGKGTKNVSESMLAKAREMVATISQKMCIIRYYGGNNIEESFSLLDKEGVEVRDSIKEEFGVDYELIKELVLTGFINRDLLDLKFS